MAQRHRILRWLVACLVVAFLAVPMVGSAHDEQEGTDVLARIQELFANRESKRFVTPLPNSRSIVIAIDGSADFFFYLERGSLRGDAIDTFYEQYEAGDLEAAYTTFSQNSLTTLRISDYGWNGLGTPMTTEEGNEISDVHFRIVEGTFQRTDPSDEDVTDYVELLRTVILPALESSE